MLTWNEDSSWGLNHRQRLQQLENSGSGRNDHPQGSAPSWYAIQRDMHTGNKMQTIFNDITRKYVENPSGFQGSIILFPF